MYNIYISHTRQVAVDIISNNLAPSIPIPHKSTRTPPSPFHYKPYLTQPNQTHKQYQHRHSIHNPHFLISLLVSFDGEMLNHWYKHKVSKDLEYVALDLNLYYRS